MQDYLLPELESLQASLALDMDSRTAGQYTYYLSSLRDIVRSFPDDWQCTTKSLVMRQPYASPKEIVSTIDQELVEYPFSQRTEVLTAVRSLALTLLEIQDAVANSLRA